MREYFWLSYVVRRERKRDMHADQFFEAPLTAALQRASVCFRERTSIDDLLFLEAWEVGLVPNVSAVLRIRQIRRANPALAAEIRAELSGRLSQAPGLSPSGTQWPAR